MGNIDVKGKDFVFGGWLLEGFFLLWGKGILLVFVLILWLFSNFFKYFDIEKGDVVDEIYKFYLVFIMN